VTARHTFPAFRPDLLIETVDEEGILIVSDREQYVLCGRIYVELLALLQGELTREDILGRLDERFSWVRSRAVLRKLDRLGFIRDVPNTPEALTVRARHQPSGARSPSGRITYRSDSSLPSMSLRTLEPLDATPWRNAFRWRGFGLDRQDALPVVLVDSYLRSDLERVAESLVNDPWLLMRPVGSEIWIGPLFEPGKTGCYHCLLDRLRRNRPVEAFILKRTDRSPAALHPASHSAVADLLAAALRPGDRNATTYPSPESDLSGTVVAYNLDDGRATPHPVPRRPQCNACGSPTEEDPPRPAPPIRIDADAIDNLLDPITGIITGCRDLAKLPVGVHAVEARFGGRPTGPSLTALRRSLKTATGKGWTMAEARASALGEAIERYSAVFQGGEPRRRASLRDLDVEALDPTSFLLFSVHQFRGRDSWNEHNRRSNRVPRSFDPDEPIDWSPVRSLTERRERYLPTAYLYDDYPQEDEAAYCWFDPNGCAAAATATSAALAGLLELIERDAAAIWWYNRLQRRRLRYESVCGYSAAEIERLYRLMGREHWVLDLTTDLDIPAFAAVSRRIDMPIEQPLFGFACHLDPEIALSRALVEMNQIIGIVRDAEAGPRGLGIEMESWQRSASVATEPYLAPADSRPTELAEVPSRSSGNDEGDLAICRRVVEDAGHDVLLLDLTRPDIGVPVARVIAPGLRPCYARFAPGRLYDVPLEMGLLSEATPEDELNPVSFLL
jgi:bacteriocin biosynthesis cyclodehydratase domain-containing protein